MLEEFDGLDLPPRPHEPMPGECCGCGCEHCVYIYYDAAIKRWELKVAQLKNECKLRNKIIGF
jgi:hypothetical protein